MKNNESLPPVVKDFSLRDRKVWILLVIVAATLYVFATQWSDRPASRPATAKTEPVKTSPAPSSADLEGDTAKPQPRGPKKTDALSTSDPVLMPKLVVEPEQFNQEKRNLFAFFVPPPPPPPEPVCGDGICNGRENYETCPAECQPPPPPPPPPVCGDKKCEGNEDYMNCDSDCEPPPPPPITLKYIGYMSDDLGPISFLTDGKEVFMGRVNDIIANRYKVIRITEEGVELALVKNKTGQSQMIPFQGNK